ncbi:MAG: hypothetical protein IJX18_03280, partial [Clostridia bacterium]|nr:hypothetical protein [Clostridia bacterium]
MKRKILKKSIIVALLATFCVAPFAPTSQKVLAASAPEGRPTYYEVPNEFRLVAYGTPPTVDVKDEEGVGQWVGFHDYNNVENWQTMKDCGFEYTQAIYYEDADEDYIRSLENADKVNAANPEAQPIKVLISNYDYMNPNSLASITREGGTYAEAMAKIREREDAIKARYDVFASYDSFAGIFGADEPSAHMFEA